MTDKSKDLGALLFKPSNNQKPTITVEKEMLVLTETDPVKISTTISPLPQDLLSDCQETIVQADTRTGTYTGIQVDSKEDGLLQAIGLMEGTPYTVEYYQQYMGRDDETAALSTSRPVALQQYRRIDNFEIRVSSPWNYSHDTENQEDELTGDGYVYPIMKPNKGDMFIADIGDGRSGLVEIDSVERLSHRRYSAYKIEYHVREFLTKQVHEHLQAKTIDHYYFDKQRMLGMTNPFIEHTEIDVLIKLEKLNHRMIGSYFKWFYDIETSALTVPLNNGYRTNDIGQCRFVDAIIDKYYHPEYRKLRGQMSSYGHWYSRSSIWEAILSRDWYALDDANTKFRVVATSALKSFKLNYNAYYSQYHYLIDDGLFAEHQLPLDIIPAYTAPAQIPIYIEEDITTSRRYIYPIGHNQDYVFSEYFYLEDKDRMSRLELMVYDYLNGRNICPHELYRLFFASSRWNDLERYYYIPILIHFTQQTLAGVFNGTK